MRSRNTGGTVEVDIPAGTTVTLTINYTEQEQGDEEATPKVEMVSVSNAPIHGTEQEVIVGQDIKLKAVLKPASPPGYAVSESEWTVPGVVAQEWKVHFPGTPTKATTAELDELEESERKKSGGGEHPIQFYWIQGTEANQKHEVQSEYKLGGGAGSVKGVVKFTVVEPELIQEDSVPGIQITSAGTWSLSQHATLQIWGLALLPEFEIQGAYSEPAGSENGIFISVQVVDVAVDAGLGTSGSSSTTSGLDKSFPYAYGTIIHDAPGVELTPLSEPRRYTLEFSGWFLFQPAKFNQKDVLGRYVPLHTFSHGAQGETKVVGNEVVTEADPQKVWPLKWLTAPSRTTQYPSWAGRAQDNWN